MITSALIGMVVGLQGSVVAGGGAMDGPGGSLTKQVMDRVSAEHAIAIVNKLAGFGTRHTLSETASSERGIGAARNWIKSEMEQYSKAGGGRLEVSFESFKQEPRRRVAHEVE